MKLLALLGMMAIGLTAVAQNLETNEELLANATQLDKIPTTESLLTAKWEYYTSAFDKEYEKNEEEVRKELFFENYKKIMEHNRRYNVGQVSYKLGINQFTDKTNIEMAIALNKLKGNFKGKLLQANYYRRTGITLPASVDWRKLDSPPLVKNQGTCGSCWAFATTSSEEYYWKINSQKNEDLSMQELMDCVKENFGCNGGYVSKALEYIIANRGISIANDYPYAGKVGTCKSANFNKTAPIKGYFQIVKGDEQSMMEVLATKGPVIVGMDSSRPTMFGYASGVYSDVSCSSTLVDHGVLVVGYGTTWDGIDYWIIQNSWGTNWGEGGFMRINRKNNLCGVCNQPFVIIM